MAKFEFDKDAFERAVLKAAEGGLRQRADELQQLVDGVVASHGGRPIEEVKVALQSAWRSTFPGHDITDPELTQWATEISEGRGISVVFDGVK